MRKKSINKSLYESIMTGVSKVVKRLLLLNEMNRRPLIESTFTDDDADLLDDESVFGRYNGIQGLITAQDKDKVFKFGTILFVNGGLKGLATNNNKEIIADNFENPTFDEDELSNIIEKHKKERRTPVAFCFGKNDDGKYVFGLPGNGKYINFSNSFIKRRITDNAHWFSWDKYDDNIMSIDELIKELNITDKSWLRREPGTPGNLLDKIYTYRNKFNNKLNINAPDEYACELLHKIGALGWDSIIFDILNIAYLHDFWIDSVNIQKSTLGCYSIDFDGNFYYISTDDDDEPRPWFLIFTL